MEVVKDSHKLLELLEFLTLLLQVYTGHEIDDFQRPTPYYPLLEPDIHNCTQPPVESNITEGLSI